MFFRVFDRFQYGICGNVGQRREDSAGVKPTRAECAEYVVAVYHVGRQLGSRRVCPVGGSRSASDSEAPVNEIQAVAYTLADAVIFEPLYERCIRAACPDEVFGESAEVVVGKRGDHSRSPTKTA